MGRKESREAAEEKRKKLMRRWVELMQSAYADGTHDLGELLELINRDANRLIAQKPQESSLVNSALSGLAGHLSEGIEQMVTKKAEAEGV